MRILIVSAVFPPISAGGAEVSAQSLATWLAEQGHAVTVYTTVPAQEAAGEERVGGYTVVRQFVPRTYYALEHAEYEGVRKGLWHLQDHAGPANRRKLGEVIDRFRPDVVNFHLLQGAGWNMLRETAERDLPTVITLHDLGLGCLNVTMHRKDRPCPSHCLPCRLSTSVKRHWLGAVPRLSFIAPSQSVIDRLDAVGALPPAPRHVIPNAIRYPQPPSGQDRVSAPANGPVRLIYAGAVTQHKGVALAIGAAARVAGRQALTLDILGSGPELSRLRRQWADASWLRFHGQVSLQEVATGMAISDLLLVPSTWAENAPGVVIQAITMGLPVLGSALGGIPELIRPGDNGLLLPPGDESAWADAIETLVRDPAARRRLGRSAAIDVARFDPDRSGKRMLKVFEQVLAS